MKNKLKVYQTKNIKNYKLVLETLVAEWGYIYWDAILRWCGIIDDTKDGKYWQVWVIQYDKMNIGICGLFSHKIQDESEL